MTNEKIIEILNDYPNISKRIIDYNLRLASITKMRDEYSEALPKAQAITGMPSANSGISDSTFNALMDVLSVLDRYNSDIKYLSKQIIDLLDLKEKIDRFINALPYNDQKIIKMRHFEGKTWEWISAQGMCTRQWLPKQHNRVITKLVDKWNDCEFNESKVQNIFHRDVLAPNR